MIDDRDPLDATIHTVAVRRLGAVDTRITRATDRDFDTDGRTTWYMLSVRLTGDGEWQPLGRRRTKQELLAMVSTFDPRHVDGKNLGCWRSTRPARAIPGASWAIEFGPDRCNSPQNE